MKVLHKKLVKNCKKCHILEKNDKKVAKIDRPTFLCFYFHTKTHDLFLLVFTFCYPISTQLAIFPLLCQSHISLSISSSFPKNSFNFCSLLKYYKKPSFLPDFIRIHQKMQIPILLATPSPHIHYWGGPSPPVPP